MTRAAAVSCAIAMIVGGCAPYPVAVAPAPVPLVAYRAHWDECALIRSELARQQNIAAYSGVMSGPLVQGAVLMNVSTVVSSLQTRAAIEGCPI